MYLINFQVDRNELTLKCSHSDYTGRIILELNNSNFDFTYFDIDNSVFCFDSILEKILLISDSYVIINVSIDNKHLLKKMLSVLNNSKISFLIILIGIYVMYHYEEFFFYDNLKIYAFQYLQEHNIKYLLQEKSNLNDIKGLIIKNDNKILFNKKDTKNNLYSITKNYSPLLSKTVSVNDILNEGYFFSHGCNKNCKFCNVSQILEKTFYKPLELIESELLKINSFLSEKSEIKRLEIMDEDFFSNMNFSNNVIEIMKKLNLSNLFFTIQTRVEKLNKQIIDNLQKINVKEISVGIESIKYKKIKFYKNLSISKWEYYKRLLLILKYSYSKNICIGINFIFGLPDESFSDLILILLFLSFTKNCDVNINFLNLIKNTYLWKNYKDIKKNNKNSIIYNLFFSILIKKKKLYFLQSYFYKLTLEPVSKVFR